jgi:hypothetical protein
MVGLDVVALPELFRSDPGPSTPSVPPEDEERDEDVLPRGVSGPGALALGASRPNVPGEPPAGPWPESNAGTIMWYNLL